MIVSLSVLALTAVLPQLLAIRGLYFVLVSATMLSWMWFYILSSDERESLRLGWKWLVKA